MDALPNSEPGSWRRWMLGDSLAPSSWPVDRSAGDVEGMVRGAGMACSGLNRSLPVWLRGGREARPGLK